MKTKDINKIIRDANKLLAMEIEDRFCPKCKKVRSDVVMMGIGFVKVARTESAKGI